MCPVVKAKGLNGHGKKLDGFRGPTVTITRVIRWSPEKKNPGAPAAAAGPPTGGPHRRSALAAQGRRLKRVLGETE